jgi:Flp pilus assembly protein TadG
MFRHNPGEDIGQAFVELALVLPIFILLMVGAAEIGRLAYASIEVNNAARAGVAYGAQTSATAKDTDNIKSAATQEAPDIHGLAASGGVTAVRSCFCESAPGVMTSADCTTIDTTSCASPSRIVQYVQVNTSAAVDTAFHFPGIPSSITMRGKALMRVEQP